MIISFSDTARVEQNFTDDRRLLRQAVAAIKPSCRSTQLSEALRLAAGFVDPAARGTKEAAGEAGQKGTVPSSSDESRDSAPAAGAKVLILSDGKFPAVSDVELGIWSRSLCRSAARRRRTWRSSPSASAAMK